MMVDPVRLGKLLLRLGEETAALARLAARDQRQRLDDDGLAAVKYRFIVAIEAAIDAGQHVILHTRLGDFSQFRAALAAQAGQDT